MKHISILWLMLLALISVRGQDRKITIETKADIVWAGVDRPGDLFLVLKTGEVQKFNKEGKELGSHGVKSPPTVFDPMDGVQSFFYLQNENLHGNLSSDLASATEHPLDPAFAISPWLVCPSLHELWILDSSDFSIKKTKMNATTISIETSLKHEPKKKATDYVYMREYQNYLFVLDKNAGIHLFNGIGIYVKTIDEKNLSYFNFLGEEIYFLKGNELIFIDLFTNEKRSVKIPVACRFALLNDDRLYAVEASRVTIVAFKP